eukprot:gene16875-biopygen10629
MVGDSPAIGAGDGRKQEEFVTLIRCSFEMWLPWGVEVDPGTMILTGWTKGSIASDSPQLRGCCGMLLVDINDEHPQTAWMRRDAAGADEWAGCAVPAGRAARHGGQGFNHDALGRAGALVSIPPRPESHLGADVPVPGQAAIVVVGEGWWIRDSWTFHYSLRASGPQLPPEALMIMGMESRPSSRQSGDEEGALTHSIGVAGGAAIGRGFTTRADLQPADDSKVEAGWPAESVRNCSACGRGSASLAGPVLFMKGHESLH